MHNDLFSVTTYVPMSIVDSSRYHAPRSEDSDEFGKSTIIPAGRPYLTKINGKLVMARDKKPKASDIAIDLLREAFGTRPIVRRRSRSTESKPLPNVFTGPLSTCAQVPVFPYITPISQQPSFQPFIQNQQAQIGGPLTFIPYSSLPWTPSMTQTRYPRQYQECLDLHTGRTVQPAPSEEETGDLNRIKAHFDQITSKKARYLPGGAVDTSAEKELATKTTGTTAKHVCENCRRLRSRKVHVENPIKPGDTPSPAFCRKCQKDSSNETSDSGDANTQGSKPGENKSRPEKV